MNEMGNLHEVNILEVTKENYIVPEGEEHLYHCRIEQKMFNQSTGERISVPRIQKFDAKMFERTLLHNLRRIGYSVEVLYDPTKYNEGKKAQQAQKKQMSRQAQEEAIQKRIEEAVAKALAAERAKAEPKVEEKPETEAVANAKPTRKGGRK